MGTAPMLFKADSAIVVCLVTTCLVAAALGAMIAAHLRLRMELQAVQRLAHGRGTSHVRFSSGATEFTIEPIATPADPTSTGVELNIHEPEPGVERTK
jgi:hypothetical protein